MQHVVGTSDGDGNIIEMELNPDEVDGHFPGQNDMQTPEENPFEGLSTVKEEGSIPDSMAHIFNKICEVEIDGVTFKYREITELDRVSLGENPMMVEALTAYDQNSADLDAIRFAESLSARSQDEIYQLSRNVALYRDKVLLISLISMRCGDEEIEISEEHIAAMTDKVKNDLQDIINRVPNTEDQAELESAKRFHKKPRKKRKAR